MALGSGSLEDNTCDGESALAQLQSAWNVEATTDLITFLDSTLEWSEDFFTVFTHRYISIVREAQMQKFPKVLSSQLAELSLLARNMKEKSNAIVPALSYFDASAARPTLENILTEQELRELKADLGMPSFDDGLNTDEKIEAVEGTRMSQRISFRILEKLQQEHGSGSSDIFYSYSGEEDEAELQQPSYRILSSAEAARAEAAYVNSIFRATARLEASEDEGSRPHTPTAQRISPLARRMNEEC